jgi:transcription antitermination factor NusB
MVEVVRSRPAVPNNLTADRGAPGLSEAGPRRVVQVEAIDRHSEAASGWHERMNIIDRLILRLAVFEFLEEKDTPATVIINEAIELARSFSNDESVAFVNGVLDAIRRRLERA